MSTALQIELQDGDILAALDRAIGQLERPGELFQDIGAKLEANASLRFDTKTDPTGKAWAPITQATKDIYESDWFIARNPAFKGGIPGTLLERTRQLRQSLAYNAGVDYVEIGTSRKVGKKGWQVGALMEWGTERMERRGILTADPKTGRLGAEDQADVLAIVNGWLSGAFA